MTDKWKCIFNGSIENRPVKIEIYDEGGYRVHTTQGADDFGTVESDVSSILIIPPTEKGIKIIIEGEILEEIQHDLQVEGFSMEASSEIIGKFSL